MNGKAERELCIMSFRPKGEIFKIPHALRSFGMTWGVRLLTRDKISRRFAPRNDTLFCGNEE